MPLLGASCGGWNKSPQTCGLKQQLSFRGLGGQKSLWAPIKVRSVAKLWDLPALSSFRRPPTFLGSWLLPPSSEPARAGQAFLSASAFHDSGPLWSHWIHLDAPYKAGCLAPLSPSVTLMPPLPHNIDSRVLGMRVWALSGAVLLTALDSAQ